MTDESPKLSNTGQIPNTSAPDPKESEVLREAPSRPFALSTLQRFFTLPLRSACKQVEPKTFLLDAPIES